MTSGVEYVPIREACARYVSPDDLDHGYALIDQGTEKLMKRIMLACWTVRGSLLAMLAALILLVEPGYQRLAAGLVLLAAAAAFELRWQQFLQLPFLSFLYPKPHPKISEFMDLLASGEVKAYASDEPTGPVQSSRIERKSRR